MPSAPFDVKTPLGTALRRTSSLYTWDLRCAANGVADGMSADQVVDVSGSAASGGEGTDGTKPDGAGVAQPAEEAPIN